jgi:hypothetical protein
MFPTIYLTLLSMVQALALEVLWSAVNQHDYLWSRNATALTGWLQAIAVFQLIFFIWVAYAHVVMRFRWVVSVRDSLIPFVLGVAEFALIGLIHPDRVHLWFYGLAFASGFGAWVALVVVRQVWEEPDNADLLAAIGQPRPLLYSGPLLICVLLAAGQGLLMQLYRDAVGLTVSLVGMVNLVLLSLNLWYGRFWRRAIAG